MKTMIKSPYFAGVLLSLLISLIVLSHQQAPNTDGFLYMRVAQTYLNQGYGAARELFSWPFYSILFGYIRQITGLSIENSVIVLNSLLSVGLVLAFTLTVQLIYQKRRYVWLGLLVILCFQTYNHVRHDIIRGHGYWTFALLALCCLIQLLRTKQWRYGILWTITIIIAMLFRIEGAILLLFGSVFLIKLSKQEFCASLYLVLKANCLFLIAGLIGVFVLVSYYDSDLTHLNRLNEILYLFSHPIEAFLAPYQHVIQNMREFALPVVAKSNVDRLLIGGIISTVIWMTFTSLTPIYAVLSFYGIYYRVLPPPANRLVMGWVLLNTVLVTLFVFRLYFLDKRYVLLLCLLLMLWIPGGLINLYEKIKAKVYPSRINYLIIAALIFAFVYLVIASLGHFGVSKAYITQGSRWLRAHRVQNTLVLTNNHKINYYSRIDILNDKTSRELSSADIQEMLKTGANKYPSGTYVALVVSRHHHDQFDVTQVSSLYVLEKTYRNRRGDHLFLFKKL